MKKLSLFSKATFTGLLCICGVSFAMAFSGFLQIEAPADGWLSLVRVLGMGGVGIGSIMVITRLIQALKNTGGDQRVTENLLAVILRLDAAITLLNTITHTDHDRMLKHDDDVAKRMESLAAIENQALSNHNLIIQNQLGIIKQLDRIEGQLPS
jgi:hypothetical protein